MLNLSVGKHYSALFGNDPSLDKLRNAYAIPALSIKDPERQRLLNAFFFWIATVVIAFLFVRLGLLAVAGLAIVPGVIHVFVGVARLTPVLRIKRLAWTEVAASVVFGVSLIAVERWCR